MKRFLLLVLFIIPALMYAQESTLLSGEVDHGGFGGPVVKMTRINGADALLVGARGGWIINHTFVIGLGGYGLVTDIVPKTPGLFGTDRLLLGYGGLELEFIMASDEVVHVTFPVLIGAGAVGYRSAIFDDDWGLNLHLSFDQRYDTFFVIEPAVNVELNVASFFRIAAGVSYRHVTGVNAPVDAFGTPRPLTTNADLRGVSGMLVFKFGSF